MEPDTTLRASPGHSASEAPGPDNVDPEASSGLDRPVFRSVGVVDLVLAVAAGVLALVAHDVGYMMHHPFWVDEAWVADSVRANLGSLPMVTSSTPFGWTLLLQPFRLIGDQGLRLLPLLFTVLTSVTAYFLGRELRLDRYRTGVLMAVSVTLLPAMLVRDDLKQYTAEAFMALLIFYMLARLGNGWSLRLLGSIAVAGGFGILIANTAVIVGSAVIGGLLIENLVRRDWPRVLRVSAAGAAMLAAALALYWIIDRPDVNPALKSYWKGSYLPRSPGKFVSTLHHSLARLAPYAGFRSLILDAVLIVGGIVALVALRRFAMAAVLPLILAANIVGSLARFYPFGDLRTSTYWLVFVPVLASVAVAAVARLLTRVDPRLPATVIVLAGALWAITSHSYFRGHPLPREDVRSQASYVASHYRPGDSILVGLGGSWGFAYYYDRADPSFTRNPTTANGFSPTYPDAPWITVLRGRTPADVERGIATAQAAQQDGRIWVVLSHISSAEAASWSTYLDSPGCRVIPVGAEPLGLCRPAPSQ